MSDIHLSLNGSIEFTREWFEGELERYFETRKLLYVTYKKYSLPTERIYRCEQENESEGFLPVNDIDIVFLAGGTCRIPFVREWIRKQFSERVKIIEDELEIITAKGAAIHALQVLNGEIEPYIKITEYEDDKSDMTIDKLNKMDKENSYSKKDLSGDEKTVGNEHRFGAESCG